MYRLEKYYNGVPYTSKAFELYFGGLSMGVLDIETTGLSPERAQFILGGLSVYDKSRGQMKLTQLLAESRGEEKALLCEYIREISKLDLLITYNGKHFDLNFLRRRLALSGLDLKELGGHSELPYNLDLYLVLNGFSPLRKLLPNLKQKSVEDFFGLWELRDDRISGGDSVELYERYLRCRSRDAAGLTSAETARLRDIVLLHNADDVMQLGRLVKATEKADFHKAMFKMGFPAGKNAELLVAGIEFRRDFLRISGRQRKDLKDYTAYPGSGSECFVRFDGRTGDFELRLPLRRQAGLAFADLTKIWAEGGGNCEGEQAEARAARAELMRYPRCQSGFLVLQQSGETYYRETNHLVKLLLNSLTDL